jgi:hypothetical protein
MAVSNLVAGSSGLSVQRFEATQNRPFQIPAGLTLQNTVTSTTTFTAGQLPAQVFVVMAGGGGGGSRDTGAGGGGGGTCIGWVDVPSAGITATIGAGGAAVVGTSCQYYGSPGGNTFFGAYVAYGGGGGMSTNDTFGSNGNGQQRQVYPRGPGAGWGGFNPSPTSLTSIYPFIQGCAPFLFNMGFTSAPSTSSNVLKIDDITSIYGNNYTGGGVGGTRNNTLSGTFDGTGGSGLTGGGGTYNGSVDRPGGNSSRNGGISNTFTGGTAGGTTGYAGGGAGLLANGGAGGGVGSKARWLEYSHATWYMVDRVFPCASNTGSTLPPKLLLRAWKGLKLEGPCILIFVLPFINPRSLSFITKSVRIRFN